MIKEEKEPKEDAKSRQENSEKAHEICAEMESMVADRGNLDSHLQEIAQRMIPSHSNLFTGFGNDTKGDKRMDFVYDSTAAIALNRFAAILDSLLTPRNSIWHRLSTNNSELSKIRAVQEYFEESTRALFRYRYAAKANFASQNQQVYLSLGGYGTGSLFIDQLDSEPGLRYKNIHLSEIFFSENHQGIIDKALRRFKMKARQAMQKWGEKCPKKIQETAKKNPEQEFIFIHCVKPREKYDPERKDSKNMPFASYYVSMEGKTLLNESGYTTFPYPAGRYHQVPGEVYGRSPAMEVLPAVKTLNEEKKMMLTQGHRSVNPVLLAHDDGIVDSFSLKPGAINYGGVSAAGQPLVHTLPVGNYSIGKDMMDDERAVINDSFLVTLFQVLVESPNMTATEVLERTREKGILLAPTVGRQQDEYLGPVIERELDVLSKQGLLPPMPPELIEAKGDYAVVYESPLSKMQKVEEIVGFQRTFEMGLAAVNATGDRSHLYHFNLHKALPEIAEIQGAPLRWMTDPAEVQARMQADQQAAQEQQAIDAAPATAQMISAAAKAKQVSRG